MKKVEWFTIYRAVLKGKRVVVRPYRVRREGFRLYFKKPLPGGGPGSVSIDTYDCWSTYSDTKTEAIRNRLSRAYEDKAEARASIAFAKQSLKEEQAKLVKATREHALVKAHLLKVFKSRSKPKGFRVGRVSEAV